MSDSDRRALFIALVIINLILWGMTAIVWIDNLRNGWKP